MVKNNLTPGTIHAKHEKKSCRQRKDESAFQHLMSKVRPPCKGNHPRRGRTLSAHRPASAFPTKSFFLILKLAIHELHAGNLILFCSQHNHLISGDSLNMGDQRRSNWSATTALELTAWIFSTHRNSSGLRDFPKPCACVGSSKLSLMRKMANGAQNNTIIYFKILNVTPAILPRHLCRTCLEV